MTASQRTNSAVAFEASATPSVLRQWITRHPVLAYLILAYAIGWTILLVPLLSKAGLGVFPYDVPPIQLFVLLADLLALTGSAFTVTALVDGRTGVRALASRLVRWRVGIQWYLVAFFGLLVLGLVTVGLFHGLAPLGALTHQGSALLGFLVTAVLVGALVNLWEETGWSGFMFTRLQPRYGALVASLMVAPCFGGIHLPGLFITGLITTGKLSPSQYALVIVELLVLFSIPVRVLGAWLYNNARGSVLIVGLYHAAYGAATGSVLLHALNDAQFYGAMAVVAVLLVLLTRGRLGYKPSPDLAPTPSVNAPSTIPSPL